ncbi:MAG: 1,4-alpha-glucan branching protein domain-containing protein [Solirubrobacteraceae bacterium]
MTGRTSSGGPGGGGGGELAIVLHTHMPYVEGFDRWPFGEEWLWEAMAGSYLPLLDLLDAGAPLTVSLTPVLCDQLEADGVADRFREFLTGVRRETHRLDAAELHAAGAPELAAEIERSAGDYEWALARFDGVGGDLLGALAPHATWTSAATHGLLPLCATDAGVRLQVAAGVASHRVRFGAWGGGFWLPECAYAPWLDPVLAAAGVRACCVELTDHFGLGSAEHLRPRRTPDGPVLVPIDRATVDLVWHETGYPAAGAYRDHHRHTTYHHRPWANDGRPYDHARARALAAADAADFVRRTRDRLGRHGGLAVCAMDTEFLGHWWYEGVAWLSAVVAEAAAQGLALVRLDDALTRHPPVACRAEEIPIGSWGAGGTLETWSGPAVADLAFGARDAELRVLAAGPAAGAEAARELLALQASDWAFLKTRGSAGDYPARRAAGHTEALGRALAGDPDAGRGTRNLAVHAGAGPLLEP